MYKVQAHEIVGISRDSFLKKVFRFVQIHGTTANLIGLGGGLFALLCLLILPTSQNWNIRLPLYLVLVVWTLLRPRIALYLLVIAVPWGSLDPIPLAGLNLDSADILVFLLIISWLLSFVLRPLLTNQQSGALDQDAYSPPRVLVFGMLALLLAMVLSLMMTLNFSLSLKEIVKWIEAFSVLLLGTQYIRTRRHIWTLLILLCLAAISQAFLGYAQYAFNLGPASFVRGSALRVYGTFDQPNPYAGYINVSLTLAFALMIFGKGLALRTLSALTLLLLIGAELLSQSKGGYLALAVALLFILISGLSRHRGLILAIFIAVLTLVALYLAGLISDHMLSPLLQRLGITNLSFIYPTNDNYANSERLAHWVAGLLMFRDHPLFGVGIGNYGTAYAQYAQGIFIIPLGHAHNYYINIAAEAGSLGLLGLLWFLTATFVIARRSLQTVSIRLARMQTDIKKPTGNIELAEACKKLEYLQKLVNDRALMVGLIGALLSVCIHNIVDDLYVHSMTSLFTLLIVMIIGLAKNGAKRA